MTAPAEQMQARLVPLNYLMSSRGFANVHKTMPVQTSSSSARDALMQSAVAGFEIL